MQRTGRESSLLSASRSCGRPLIGLTLYGGENVSDQQQQFGAAADEYGRLRRRFWRLFLCGVASFAAFGLPMILAGERMPPALRGTFGAATALTGLVCWIGAVSTWLMLLNWRCPRCGKRFLLSSTSSWPTGVCKHCGLDLSSATRSAG
jgi:hypothetical protein